MNKIDKSDADQDRVKNELATQNLIPKEWGGDTTFVPISAKTDEGIDTLLDSILVQAEILELDAMLDCSARGIVIESRLDKGRCVVASVLVQQSVRVSSVPVPGLVRVLVNNRLVGIGEALADGHVAPKRLFY